MIEVDKSVTETGAHAWDDGAAADVWELNVPPLELQPKVECSDADRYQLDELLRYHDRAFVAHAYAALQKRAPTAAEFTRTLGDLRAGRCGKIQIIEALCAGQSAVHVAGLPSPLARRMRHWPLLGYVLRVLRGITRLPVLIQHQQQFESYALGQQQCIADYINEMVATGDDAVESVLMLSESLLDLSARHAELQARLTHLQLDSQAQQTQQAQARLHSDPAALTDALTAQQQALAQARRAQAATAASQQEFLVQEQRVIVETQQVTLGELQTQLRELAAEQERKGAELSAEMRSLRSLVAALREHATVQADEQAVVPDREQA